ncbi:hypothetical protein NLJ89_g4725 [Agrocybe chaxingu]|uniref:Uncharacterized protein n=1 Tax=Agrocybe chaxingu TaxID=84603 RepID=A0A9W8MXH3_9AGAR|nr:hypothetical protein NLJ89_g4725 [Agrocybe chaxingu]
MANVYLEFIYWGFLGLLNLAVSALVYYTTKLERKRKIAAQASPSTRATYDGLTFPSSFAYVSVFTGVMNMGGAYLRCRRIHFLEIPSIPWLHDTIASMKGGDEFLKLLEAKWLVAMNDWTSLFVATTFFLAGCVNFATVRQLRLRDKLVRGMLLPMSSQDEKMRLQEKGGETRAVEEEEDDSEELFCAKRR